MTDTVLDRELSVLVDLITEAYPQLAIMTNLGEWQAGKFDPPVAFIQAQVAMEKGNTLTSYTVICDAGLTLQHPLLGGVYQPISTEPLRELLRQRQYSYRGSTSGLSIDIDNETMRVWGDKKDRTELTFRFSYTVHISKSAGEKINTFDIEGV